MEVAVCGAGRALSACSTPDYMEQIHDSAMEKVDVLLGLQWGDEGKGKIVDVLTPAYDLIAPYPQGSSRGIRSM